MSKGIEMATIKRYPAANIAGTILLVTLIGLVIYCDQSGTLDPLGRSAGAGVYIAEMTSDAVVLGSDGESTLVTVYLADNESNPYPNGIVSFYATSGSITPYDTTDDQGMAEAVFTSGEEAVIDTVTAIVTNVGSGNIYKQLFLTIESKTVISLSAEATSLLADGVQTTKIVVYHTDGSGNPIEDQQISLLSDFGDITPEVVTDYTGRATATFTAPVAFTDSAATIIGYIGTTAKTASGSDKSSDETADLVILPAVRADESNFGIHQEKSIDGVLGKVAALDVVNLTDTLRVGLVGVHFTLSAEPDSLSITEAGISSITARLTTTLDTALISKEITFSTNLGTLDKTTAVTDENGRASIQLQTAQSTGVATVTATYLAGIEAISYVRFFSAQAQQVNLKISANPTEIQADGKSTSAMSIILTDYRNNPIEGASINLSTDFGRINATAVTNETGEATASLYSERTNGIATITAQYGNVVRTTKVSFTGVDLSITADPTGIVADGVTTSEITAVLKDAAGVPIESEPVVLHTTHGTFDNDSTTVSGVTDVNGEFTGRLKGEGTENAVVTVTAGGAQSDVEVVFNQFITTVVPDGNSFIAGADSMGFTFTIQDRNYAGQENKRVVFGTSLGTLTVTEAFTDANGQARTYLKSAFAGDATVSAKVFLDSENYIIASGSVTVLSSLPDSVLVFADPNVVAVNGGTSTIRAFVTDASGNPVPNQTVSFNFEQPLGGGEKLNPTSAITDSTGAAVTTFTSGFLASKEQYDVVVRATIQEYLLSGQVVLTVAGEPYIMSTEANPPPLQNADGSFSLNITAILSDINGNPVIDGTKVYFSAQPPQIGTINSNVETTNGIAIGTLTYQSSSAGKPITITSTSGQIKSILYIEQLPGFVNDIIIIGSNQSGIYADGSSQLEFRVRLVDASDNPVSGIEVSFSANPGNSDSDVTKLQYLTDELTQNPNWGVATFVLKSVPLVSDIYPEIIINAGGLVDTFQVNNQPDSGNPVRFKGITLDVNADDSRLLVGNSTNINVSLKETTSRMAISGKSVSFGSSLGIIEESGVTDNSGRLTMPYTAGSAPGQDYVVASVGVSDSVMIEIADDLPGSVEFTSTDSVSVLGNGKTGTELSVVVRNDNGDELSGQSVSFLRDGVTIDGSPVTTDAQGVATIAVPGKAVATDLISEIVASAGSGISDTVKVKYLGISLTLSADPQSILLNGRNSVITAQVKETTSSNPVLIDTVFFSAPAGIIPQIGVVTNGTASVTFTSDAAVGTHTITGKIGNLEAEEYISAVVDVTVESYGVPANIYFSADTSYIMVQNTQGRLSTPVHAHITDENNLPVEPDTGVNLYTTLGTFVSGGTSASLVTNNNGVVTAELESGLTPGVAKISATVPSRGISAQSDLVIIQAGAPDTIVIVPDTLGSDEELPPGILQLNVAVLVRDVNGNPVKTGTPVTITVDDALDNPPVTVGDNSGPVLTNSFGYAVTKLTYSSADIGQQLRLRAAAGNIYATKTVTLPGIQ